MERAWLAPAVAVLGWLGGCGEPTQLIVVVDSDLEPGVEIATLEVVAQGEGALADRAVLDLAEVSLPTSLGVVPAARADEAVQVSVQAFDAAGVPVVGYLASTRFVPGQTRRLEIPLARVCRQTECEPPAEVCRLGACVPAEVDPSTLPRGPGSDPPAPLFEGPRVAMDAGVVDGGACVPDAPCDLGACAEGALRCDGETPVCERVATAPAGTPCEGGGTCNEVGRCEP